jgi:hypothetical protein
MDPLKSYLGVTFDLSVGFLRSAFYLVPTDSNTFTLSNCFCSRLWNRIKTHVMQGIKPQTIPQLKDKIRAAYDSITEAEIINAFYGVRRGLLVIILITDTYYN